MDELEREREHGIKEAADYLIALADMYVAKAEDKWPADHPSRTAAKLRRVYYRDAADDLYKLLGKELPDV
jgi:hypothetical protein